MIYTKTEALRYLCVKTSHDKVLQYRNPDYWEQYSDAAMQRLISRMNAVNEPETYWDKCDTIHYSVIDDTDGKLELFMDSDQSSQLDDIPKAISSDRRLLDYLNQLNLKEVRKKTDIQIAPSGNGIAISSQFEELMFRYAVMIMCDLWDLENDFILKGTKGTCKRFFEYLHRQRKQVIPLDCRKYQALLCNAEICGYIKVKDGVIPQPYRLDSVLPSDVIQSLSSMSLVKHPRKFTLKGKKAQLTQGIIMKNIQQIMYVRQYEWVTLPITGEMSCKEVDGLIMAYEKHQKRYRYPHRYFCFSDMNSNTAKRKLYCWGCGSSKIINSVADEIKQMMELVIGYSLKWPLCGKRLSGVRDSKEIAAIHLIELNDGSCIAIGELEFHV